jgi:hypothetical protein
MQTKTVLKHPGRLPARMELPDEVLAVFREFRTCEFSTLAKDGTPITWPTITRYQPEHQRFLITTSIGFPQKAFNIRRNPRVSLFFSDPTGSGLVNPPAVLVQGDAEAPDTVVTSVVGLEDYWRENIFGRQPAGMMYSQNALTRYLMDMYYMRILIYPRPRRITWWPAGDMTVRPFTYEVQHVA